MARVPFAKKHTYYRNVGGSYDSQGKWAEGSQVAGDFYATINPIPGAVSTVRGIEKQIRILTDFALRAAEEDSSTLQADYVLWEGDKYRVIDAQPYTTGVLDHYEFRARVIKTGS